jgi:hypothetical protein
MKTLTIHAFLFGCCLQLSGIEVQAANLNITVTGDHHDLAVAITATAPIIPRIETVTEPDRLVVDVPDVLPGVGLQKIFVNHGKLKDIRVGLLSANPCITRVVLDLFGPIQYRLLPSRNSIVVNLGEEAESAPAPIAVTTMFPVETKSAEIMAAVATTPPAQVSPERSRTRWILPILTMGTVFTMLVIALVSHIQNARMRRGL